MSSLGLAIGFGLVTASILAVASVGLTLQFGITNYINFAYGDFMTLGAYIAWQLNTAENMNIWMAMVLSAVAIGIIAVLFNWLLLAPFARRFPDLFSILIVTFALSLILLNVIQAIWGPDFKQYAIPYESPLTLGPFLLTRTQIIIIALSVALMVALQLLLTQTKLGKAMRAMSDNATLASVTGIDTRRITTITWFLTGLLAGLAGTILGLNISSITPGTGETFLFVIFASVIFGGIGKPTGAMLGALIIGLATEVSAIFINPAYKLDVAFVILIVVLLLRPQGLVASAGKA
jgi:branched-subunit amino acid ABC-type transport system permease component